MGCHGLPKDVGSQSGVPRHQRMCQCCGIVLMMSCTWPLSVQPWQICVATFQMFQAHQTMQQFRWQPNLLQVAKFLDAGMKRLQTVDPNEGSNIQSARLAGVFLDLLVFLSCLVADIQTCSGYQERTEMDSRTAKFTLSN